MADFNGKFQYLNSGGAPAQEGACRAQFDAQTFTLIPESGAPMAFDLGDLDAVLAADYEIRLPLYTGNTLLLRQLGKAYETLAHDLLDAHRNRVLQCLLLEDMQEVARFNGTFELASTSGPAEIRLFKSNLAVLPVASQSFQWRLADVDSVRFDPDNWVVVLQSGQSQLKFTRLAKRTEEFGAKLRDAISALAAQSAQALHTIFPFLNPDQLQATAALLREGQSAPVSRLAAINPKIPAALTANAVDKDLMPYYKDLVARNGNGMLYAGFKMIRPEDQQSGEAQGDEDTVAQSEAADSSEITRLPDHPIANLSSDADSSSQETLHWFFFPIPGNVVAWEASSRSGRATYFFRLVDPAQAAQLRDPAQAQGLIDSAVSRLNRVLGMLNFRRRPIYLSDDDLERDPKYHRYAIAARRLPELRQLRASFLGRAIHSSHEAWLEQVKAILEKARL
ncbi:MAG TPA: hypothetical protein VKY85_21755 [Candidatus Angelobacter sp.]|nr:hypothetical protein [Candidatus Angelobacter sp.]